MRGRHDETHAASSGPASEDCAPGVAHEISLVISRYLCALDSEDPVLLGRCFTDDVIAVYHADTPQERRQQGHQDVVGRLVSNMRNYNTRVHALGNLHIWATATGAGCVSHVTATLVRNELVMVRGIRYTDELRHGGDGWRICRREHRPLWQYNAVRAELQTPSSPPRPDGPGSAGAGASGSASGG